MHEGRRLGCSEDMVLIVEKWEWAAVALFGMLQGLLQGPVPSLSFIPYKLKQGYAYAPQDKSGKASEYRRLAQVGAEAHYDRIMAFLQKTWRPSCDG